MRQELDEEGVLHLGVGNAGTEARGETDEDEYPLAMLWLPDCEAWRGWSMRAVRRKTTPPKRILGFGKRP